MRHSCQFLKLSTLLNLFPFLFFIFQEGGSRFMFSLMQISSAKEVTCYLAVAVVWGADQNKKRLQNCLAVMSAVRKKSQTKTASILMAVILDLCDVPSSQWVTVMLWARDIQHGWLITLFQGQARVSRPNTQPQTKGTWPHWWKRPENWCRTHSVLLVVVLHDCY